MPNLKLKENKAFLSTIETLKPDLVHLRELLNKLDLYTINLDPLHEILEFLKLLRKGVVQLGQESFFKIFSSMERILSEIIKRKDNFHDGMNYFLNIFEITEDAYKEFSESHKISLVHLEMVESISSLFFEEKEKRKAVSAKERALVDKVFKEVTFFDFASSSEEDRLMIEDFILEMGEVIESIEESLLEAEDSPESFDVNMIFRGLHGIKGTASFLNMKSIQHISHAGENLLDFCRDHPEVINIETLKTFWSLVDILKLLFGNLKMRMEQVKDGNPRFPLVVQLDPLLFQIDKIIHGTTITELTREGEYLGAPSANKEEQKKLETGDENIRISGVKLEELYGMIGELTVLANLIKSDPAISALNLNTKGKIEKIGIVTDRLRGKVVDIHMLTVKGLFQRLKRLIWNLSRQVEKKLKIETSGEEIEIHKSISEALYTPLVHMLRNSVDHGIESPEERLNMGKPETGLICMGVYTTNEKLIIKIQDDGRGLDQEKILARGIDKGIVKEDDTLSSQEIYELIFHPGFSTAQIVSDISGRGVGMDVVKTTVLKLGGKILIDSTMGKGTSFGLEIPLLSNTSIIEGFVVQINARYFIIPIFSVEHTFTFKEEDYQYMYENQGGFILNRGLVTPLINLAEFFELPSFTSEDKGSQKEKNTIVVTRVDNKPYGLIVDELLSRQQLVVEVLDDRFDIRGISGGAILGNGNFGLILDTRSIIQEWIHKSSENSSLEADV